MFWISPKGVSTAHPSALTAEVGITILKPSGTRSFNRGKKNPTTLRGELVLIKGKDKLNNSIFKVFIIIPDLAKAMLTVLPTEKLELWCFTPGEDPAPWLVVFPLYILLPLFGLFCVFLLKSALCRTGCTT